MVWIFFLWQIAWGFTSMSFHTAVASYPCVLQCSVKALREFHKRKANAVGACGIPSVYQPLCWLRAYDKNSCKLKTQISTYMHHTPDPLEFAAETQVWADKSVLNVYQWWCKNTFRVSLCAGAHLPSLAPCSGCTTWRKLHTEIHILQQDIMHVFPWAIKRVWLVMKWPYLSAHFVVLCVWNSDNRQS